MTPSDEVCAALNGGPAPSWYTYEPLPCDPSRPVPEFIPPMQRKHPKMPRGIGSGSSGYMRNRKRGAS